MRVVLMLEIFIIYRLVAMRLLLAYFCYHNLYHTTYRFAAFFMKQI